ncbi:MAG: tetratricopeptide repeat protein [Candidatus Omnitrophota bacterium]
MTKKIIAILSLFLLFIPLLFAETILLKNGKTIDAKIVEKTNEAIKVNIEGISLTYYLADIETIDGAKTTASSIGNNNLLTNFKKAGKKLDDQTGQVSTSSVNYFIPAGGEVYAALVNGGEEDIYRGNYDLAISKLTKAIELNPNLPLAYNNRGIAYYYKRNFDQAVSDYSKAIEVDHQYVDAYINRGVAYCKPNYTDAYINQGVKGDPDQAISDFNKAIEINPNQGSAYYNRGIAYFCKKEYDKAWDDVHKAESLGAKKADLNFLAGLKKATGRDK